MSKIGSSQGRVFSNNEQTGDGGIEVKQFPGFFSKKSENFSHIKREGSWNFDRWKNPEIYKEFFYKMGTNESWYPRFVVQNFHLSESKNYWQTIFFKSGELIFPGLRRVENEEGMWIVHWEEKQKFGILENLPPPSGCLLQKTNPLG